MSKRASRRRRQRPPQDRSPSTRPVKRPVVGRSTIDVTMPIFGEWALAERAIASVHAAMEFAGVDYRIMVVDNGTPPFMMEDKSLITPEAQAEEVLNLLRDKDIYFRLEENIGFPAVQNKAAARGTAPYILVATADITLQQDAIKEMLAEMENPDVGVVGTFLVFPANSPHGPEGSVQHAGICFNIRGEPFHIFMAWSPNHPKVAQRREMLAVTGACFMTRRSIWNQLGGFNENYGRGTFEDMDYCFGVRSLGKKVIFTPKVRGTHFVGGSIKQGANQAGFSLPINSSIFKGKWASLLAWDEWLYW